MAPPTSTTSELSTAEHLDLFEQMVRIRAAEQSLQDLFLQGKVKGTTHLAAGHEAVAVGSSAALNPDDYVFATYRGHHHVIARGASIEACLAEIMSKSTGICQGKGGSMHLTHADGGMLGSYAIVGAHIPIAVGAAWSAQYQDSGQVSVVFFGDGATNIGAFHEALNLAAVWKLPVIFVCENNLYMEYTPIASVTAVENPAADRAASYGLPAEVIDGNDVPTVYASVSKAVARARAGDGPTIIEAMTYRHFGHSRTDPAKYRPQAEVDEWLARDPIAISEQQLRAAGIDDTDIAARRERAQDEVAAAVTAALAAPDAKVADAYTDVWADGGSSWRN